MTNKNEITYDWFDRELNLTKWTGYNLSGLESGSHKILGTKGTNYTGFIDPEYAQRFYDRGIRVVRIPFMLERLIPGYHPSNSYSTDFEYINKEYSQIIKDFVCECEKFGIDVILDCHNYGAYYFQRHGGYTSNLVSNYGAGNFSILDNRYSINASNELEIRTPGNVTRVDPFEWVVAGSGLPYTLDKFIYTATVKLKNNGNNVSNIWEHGKVIVNWKDDKNFYAVKLTTNNNIVELVKVKDNVETILDSQAFTATIGTAINVVIDFNNAVGNKIKATINGTLNLLGDIDYDMMTGFCGFQAAQMQMNVVSYKLTCFDSSNAPESNVLQNNSIELAWGKTGAGITHTTAIHRFFYEQIFKEFDYIGGIIAYDYNEPHDLQIPTTNVNYLTTATATIFQQAALDRIRELGSKKWFFWTSDDWGGGQNITQNWTNGPTGGRWGANFNIPFKDPLQRTALTFHFYADSYATPTYNNSGTFGSIDGQTPIPYTNADIDKQLDPLIKRWKQINLVRKANNQYPVPLFFGEVGSPEASTWNKTLSYTLEKLTKSGVGFSYFGVGEFLGNRLNNIMADFTEKTTVNGVEVKHLTRWQERHKVVDKFLNKTAFTLESSKKSCKKTTNDLAFDTATNTLTSTVNGIADSVVLFPSSTNTILEIVDNGDPTPATLIVEAGDTITFTQNSNIDVTATKTGSNINLKLTDKSELQVISSKGTGNGVVINFANHQNSATPTAYKLDDNTTLPSFTLTRPQKVQFIASFDLDSEPTGWTSDLAAVMTVLYINNAQDQFGDVVEFSKRSVNIFPSGSILTTDMHQCTAIFYKTLPTGNYTFDIRVLPWISASRTPVGTLTSYGYDSSATFLN